jgi:ABC-type sulfate transport system permease subunit
MSGQVLGATTTLPGLAGVALLPNTGTTKVLFYAASTLFIGGVVTLIVGTIVARSNKESN